MLIKIIVILVVSGLIALFPAYNNYRYPNYVGEKPPNLVDFFSGWLVLTIVWFVGIVIILLLATLIGPGGNCIPSRSNPC